MKWRSPRILIALILVLILLVGGGLLLAFRLGGSHSASSSNAVTFPSLPTPGPGRSTYTSNTFGYSIQYPTEWPLKEFANGADVRIFKVYSNAMPEAIAFDIKCAPNPSQLDAQSWWKQDQSADPSQQAVGFITLVSGAVAFVSVGHGQGGYTIYTLVHNQTACEIITYETNAANAKVVLSSVNTFQWQ